MKKTSRISEAEFEIMKIVWDKNPIPSSEIIERISPKAGWSPTTVKTMISRLVKKGALDFKADGKSYIYTPKGRREDYVALESESFLDRVFDGALMPMLAHFAKSKRLSPEEVQKLKDILNSKEG